MNKEKRLLELEPDYIPAKKSKKKKSEDLPN